MGDTPKVCLSKSTIERRTNYSLITSRLTLSQVHNEPAARPREPLSNQSQKLVGNVLRGTCWKLINRVDKGIIVMHWYTRFLFYRVSCLLIINECLGFVQKELRHNARNTPSTRSGTSCYVTRVPFHIYPTCLICLMEIFSGLLLSIHSMNGAWTSYREVNKRPFETSVDI